MQSVIHIGNPKSYSTFLQHAWYQAEKSGLLVYSGFRPSRDFSDWYKSNDEAILLNKGLRFQNELEFNASFDMYKKYISSQQTFALENNLPFVFSSENIAMRAISNEIDVSIKFKRLVSLLGNKNRVVLIFRNIKRAIYSMYKEFVNLGYGGDWALFLEESFILRDINYLSALLPNHQLKWLCQAVDKSDSIEVYLTNNSILPEMTADLFADRTLLLEGKVQNEGWDIDVCEAVAKQNAASGVSANYSGLMELHRFNWSKELSKDDDIWKKRRQIKINIELGKKLALNQTNREARLERDEELFKRSTLHKHLVDMKKQCTAYFDEKRNTNVKVFGDNANIWIGL